MKNAVFLFLISITCCFTSCVNNTEEPKIDCSATNLGLQIESSVKSDCQNAGSVTLFAKGGLEPYSYGVNGVDFQESRKIENLFAGNLELFVKDANGCITSEKFILESTGNSISLDVTTQGSDCIQGNTGSITAVASGGDGNYSFSLNEGAFKDSGVFTGLSEGVYQLEVTDSEGCKASSNITIETVTELTLSEDIMGIIIANCAISGCHNGTGVNPNLSTKSAIIQNANSIKSRTSNKSMPPSNRPDLSDTQIKQIACWVDGGAKDN